LLWYSKLLDKFGAKSSINLNPFETLKIQSDYFNNFLYIAFFFQKDDKILTSREVKLISQSYNYVNVSQCISFEI